jgi:8-oxo-dGTP pyrophosphatase MutT (NUDIX family)
VNREPAIFRARRIDARCEPHDWRWAAENRAAVSANWSEKTAGKPQLFNGRVLLIKRYEEQGDTVRSSYFETDFADFLAWRDLGYPDPNVANGFASAALQGSDGAYVCGVMGGGTANAGRIYFPAGTPDRSDLRADGTVDLAAGVLRELKEETGLDESAGRIADHWIVVRQWPSMGHLRPMQFAETADEIAERIRANIARQPSPELVDARVIRGPDDIDEVRMPVFLRSFFHWAFGEEREPGGPPGSRRP